MAIKTIRNNQLINLLARYKSILYFLFLFLLSDFIWKLFVHFGPNDNEDIMLVLGHDITRYFDSSCVFLAKCIYFIIHNLLGYDDFYIQKSILYFEDSIPVNVIWSCLGLKQYFMFLFIIIFYWGPKSKKIRFALFGLFALYLCNILRLLFILLIVKEPFPEWFILYNEWKHNIVWVNSYECYYRFYHDWFQLFHRDIFTWIYYDGVLFALWLIWEAKFNNTSEKTTREEEDSKT